jgi:hypothetical protein
MLTSVLYLLIFGYIATNQNLIPQRKAMHTARTTVLTTLILLLLLIPGRVLPAESRTMTFALPAPALLSILQSLQPIPIQPSQKSFSGTLAIQSIDRLHIHGNAVSLHGIVKGSNLAMHTMIAGQKLKLKLGNLSLPVACDLRLRLDRKKKSLFLTPHFTATGNKVRKNDPIAGLLNGLGGKEYPLSLSEIDKLLSRNLARTVSLDLQPVLLDMDNNTLTLGLKAGKQSTR